MDPHNRHGNPYLHYNYSSSPQHENIDYSTRDHYQNYGSTSPFYTHPSFSNKEVFNHAVTQQSQARMERDSADRESAAFHNNLSHDTWQESPERTRSTKKLPTFARVMPDSEPQDRTRESNRDSLRSSTPQFRMKRTKGGPDLEWSSEHFQPAKMNNIEFLSPDRGRTSSRFSEDDAEMPNTTKYSRGKYLDNGSPNPTPERLRRDERYNRELNDTPPLYGDFDNRYLPINNPDASQRIILDVEPDGLTEFNENVKTLNNILHNHSTETPSKNHLYRTPQAHEYRTTDGDSYRSEPAKSNHNHIASKSSQVIGSPGEHLDSPANSVDSFHRHKIFDKPSPYHSHYGSQGNSSFDKFGTTTLPSEIQERTTHTSDHRTPSEYRNTPTVTEGDWTDDGQEERPFITSPYNEKPLYNDNSQEVFESERAPRDTANSQKDTQQVQKQVSKPPTAADTSKDRIKNDHDKEFANIQPASQSDISNMYSNNNMVDISRIVPRERRENLMERPNEIVLEGELMKYKPGMNFNFVKRWVQLTQTEFTYHKSRWSANCWDTKALFSVPFSQCRAVYRVNLKLPHFQQQGHKKPEGKNQKKLYFIEIFPEENSINYLEELDPSTKGAPYEEIANISSINVLQTQEDDNSRFSANNRTLNKSVISVSKRDYQQSPRTQLPRRIVQGHLMPSPPKDSYPIRQNSRDNSVERSERTLNESMLHYRKATDTSIHDQNYHQQKDLRSKNASNLSTSKNHGPPESSRAYRSQNTTANHKDHIEDFTYKFIKDTRDFSSWTGRQKEWYFSEKRLLFSTNSLDERERWLSIINWLIEENTRA